MAQQLRQRIKKHLSTISLVDRNLRLGKKLMTVAEHFQKCHQGKTKDIKIVGLVLLYICFFIIFFFYCMYYLLLTSRCCHFICLSIWSYTFLVSFIVLSRLALIFHWFTASFTFHLSLISSPISSLSKHHSDTGTIAKVVLSIIWFLSGLVS